MSASFPRIQAALYPLDILPDVADWNLQELIGLLPDAPPVVAAVLVGIVSRPQGLQVLMTQRTRSLRQHAGQVSFPGGRVEPDDVDIRMAALRETTEEVGIPASDILAMGYLDPLRTITGFRVWPVVARLPPDYVAIPDAREVDAVFEAPLDHLLDPRSMRTITVDVRGRPRQVLEFVDPETPERRIWGASAAILYNLRQRLEHS
jgi:8-oxo-dGTP pyrophosphatase MutT (NUDIX family)